MNNARKTVNMLLEGVVADRLPGWSWQTGDERDPNITPPTVSIEWLDGEQDSVFRPECRMRLAQLNIETTNQGTDALEEAGLALLEALGLRFGSRPVAEFPKQSWAIVGGAVVGTPIGTTLILRRATGKGWTRVSPPARQIRHAVLTLEVHYVPG